MKRAPLRARAPETRKTVRQTLALKHVSHALHAFDFNIYCLVLHPAGILSRRQTNVSGFTPVYAPRISDGKVFFH